MLIFMGKIGARRPEILKEMVVLIITSDNFQDQAKGSSGNV